MEATPREQFIDAYVREHGATLRVLRSYPTDQLDLRPHSKCQTARELLWTFVVEQGLCERALTTGFDWSSPPGVPTAPSTLAEVTAAFERGRDRLVGLVAGRDASLSGTVKVPTDSLQVADVPLRQFLWLLLSDQILHRGQLSIYLRLAGGGLPGALALP